MSQAPTPDATRRERLVQAGREAFGRLPYEQVAISDIAEDAGVAHGLLFHYFRNKRGLYLEVVRSMAAELRIVHDIPPDLPPAEAVRTALNQHIDYMEERPYLLLGLTTMISGLDEQVRLAIDEARWDGALHTLGLVGADGSEPRMRLLMQGWLDYVDGVLARWLVDRSVDRAVIVETFVAVLMVTVQSAGTSMSAPGAERPVPTPRRRNDP